MIYRDFGKENLSMLGFGTMRLPVSDGKIDVRAVEEMTELAISNGVNYFDTAFPYHDGESEKVIGKILSKYDRLSYNLATKYPGHQISERYDPQAIFERQLKKCGVEYFDFYLLHNVYENSIGVYTDKRWGIIEYFLKQKQNGRIRHFGFSSHGLSDLLIKFLDMYGNEMEFCQIQLNYLDWTLQDAKAKYELLTERNIPVWVMEPVRGGKLASLGKNENALKNIRPGKSIASLAFRWLMRLDNVKVVLSGMSNVPQMKDNLDTFKRFDPLSDGEAELLESVAESLKSSIPCTACGYCLDGCPMGLDIRMLLATLNEIRYAPVTNSVMRLDALPKEKLPSACLGCGACAAVCPQKIDVPSSLAELSERLKSIRKWSDICKEREEAAKRDI